MDTTHWNPGTLLEMSGYYWRTCTLHTGVKLDIFTAIGPESSSCADINQRIKADPRGLALLLNALTAMGLLVKQGETFANSPAALSFLSKDSPQYIGFIIMHHHHLMESWQNMDKAVMEGGPIRERASFSNDEWRESFLMGMFNMGMAVAPGLSTEMDLLGCKNLLDFGGGPGTFAIHFCLANPDLKASVYDLETTRPFAEKTIEKFKVSDRVEFISGNFIEEEFPFPRAYDAAFLSHILHGEGPEDAADVVRKAVSALKPGGRIFIHEFILDNDLAGPLFPALFSINMYLGTDKGQAYSEAQLFAMLKANGVTDIRRLAFSSPTRSGVIQGRVVG
jgi:SAM-dependent methyltransferase